jgi:hypothetical protein
MHLRRGDIHSGRTDYRWLGASFYKKVVLMLRKHLHDHADIHIMSQVQSRFTSQCSCAISMRIVYIIYIVLYSLYVHCL